VPPTATAVTNFYQNIFIMLNLIRFIFIVADGFTAICRHCSRRLLSAVAVKMRHVLRKLNWSQIYIETNRKYFNVFLFVLYQGHHKIKTVRSGGSFARSNTG
jgi:hypothetical protein